jgi:hypothetical protein
MPSVPSMRALLLLTAFFVTVSVTALTGLTSWVDSLVEAILIFTVFALLLSHRAVVVVLGRAPRTLRLCALLIAGFWSWSQIRGVVIATYPFISWRMYGEPPKYKDFSGYRLLGERCNGESVVLPPSSGATGRRPVLSLAVRRAYEESQLASGDPARARERTDKLLSAILTRWNGKNPTLQLCALSLQQTSININASASAAPTQYTTVRRYDAP